MMKIGIRIGIIFSIISLFFPNAGIGADPRPGAVAEFMRTDSTGTWMESQPLNDNEAKHLAVKKGEIVGETTIQLQEMKVIIELKGEPLVKLKKQKQVSLALGAAERARARGLFKEELLRLDDRIRKGKGLSSRTPKQTVRREFRYLLHGVSAEIHKDTLKQIAAHPQVKKVWIDGTVQAFLDQSVPLIRANQVWTDLGFTGQGVTVAVIDTGIDYTHPDLGGCLGPGCKVIGGYDFVQEDSDPMDDNGHGTHVAGIVAADGVVKGVAPGAKLMAFKALDQFGRGYNSDVIAAIEKAVDPDGDPATDDGAQVINLSVGGPGDPDDPLSQAVDQAVAAGVVVVVAAGNSGPGFQTVASPGVARQALTVGMSDKIDQIIPLGSRGPAPLTYQIKPEVVAPGGFIKSSVPRGNCFLCNPSGYAFLTGTSMATPHVAGAAALILEKFPGWTPAQVKAALAGEAVNLGGDVFIQGSGRIDAFAALTPSALWSEGNLSLGWDDPSQPAFSVQRPLQLTNLQDVPRTYNLGVNGNFPPGVAMGINPATATLGPGETGTFTFSLTVDNQQVPNALAPPYDYKGEIVARESDGAGARRLPLAFIKTPTLELQFDVTPWVLTIHDRSEFFINFSSPETPLKILVPAGTYDIMVLFDATTWVVREKVGVSAPTRVKIEKAEAVHPFTLIPVGREGTTLSLNRTVGMSTFKHKDSNNGGIGVYFAVPTAFRFSPVSSDYLFEFSLMEDQKPLGGPLYTFHGHARDGIRGPITIQNSPADFQRMVMRHHPGPGEGQIGTSPLLYSNPERPFYLRLWCYESASPLLSPFEEEVYFLPFPYPDFGLGYLKKEVFRGPSTACNPQLSDFLYETPIFGVRTRGLMEGFTSGSPFTPGEPQKPVYSTASDTILSGIGPAFWRGLFQNSPREIKLLPARGFYLTLLAGQGGDIRPHSPLPYDLFKDGVFLKSASIYPYDVAMDYYSIDARIALEDPGSYTLRIPEAKYFVAGQQGSALMEASFDTRSSDPNPPYLTRFQLLEGGRLAETLQSGQGQVSFQVLDDGGIKQVAIFMDAGRGWEALPLTNNGDGAYLSNLPTLGQDTWVSLKVVAEDTSGNRLSYEMRPAFFAKGSELISAPSLPGGPSTGIAANFLTFSAGGASSSLGHPLQYLFNWGDGTDSGWLAQGQMTASKSWNVAGTFSVKVQARCAVHNSLVSPWSESLAVKISQPVTVILRSLSQDDGWVKESALSSGTGGSTGTGSLMVGDDNQNRQIKSILSFDTSGIPAGATIQSAILKMKRKSLSGSNPFSTFGSCYVDVVKGAFGQRSLERADFQAAATAPRAGTLSNPASNGAVSSGTLSASGLEAINKGGITQMRAYFSRGNNSNSRNDYVVYYSGEETNAGYQPSLEVTYLP